MIAVTPEQRQRLVIAVDRLGRTIADGTVSLDHASIVELDALAGICDDAPLPEEAARIRRWVAEARREAWLTRGDQ